MKLNQYYKKYSNDSIFPNIDYSIEFNHLQKNGSTLLHLAVINNDEELVKKIMSQSYHFNIKDIAGLACLHIAMDNNNINIAKLLVQDGADIYLNDNQDRNAWGMAKTRQIRAILYQLHNAAINNKRDEDSVLPQFKQNIPWLRKVREIRDYNPNLHTPLQKAIEEDDYNMVKQLINAGEDVFMTDNNSGKTLLHMVGECTSKIPFLEGTNTIKIAKLLISKGLSIDQQCKLGESPMCSAVVDLRVVWLQWLIDNGADPNVADKWGNSPLHNAIKYSFQHTAHMLLKTFAIDMNAKNSFGETIMDIATSKWEGAHLVKMLRDYNDEFTLRSSAFIRASISDNDDDNDDEIDENDK
jgi:ankyrin repeat protein